MTGHNGSCHSQSKIPVAQKNVIYEGTPHGNAELPIPIFLSDDKCTRNNVFYKISSYVVIFFGLISPTRGVKVT